MVPVFEIDYHRYTPEFQGYVAAPERYYDKEGHQLNAAINVLVHTGTEAAYADIAALVFHQNSQVNHTAITALGNIGRSEYIKDLLEAGEQSGHSEHVAWTLIQMGEVAAPYVAQVLRANRGDLAYKLVRQYIYRWDELPSPLGERITAAIKAGMPKRRYPYDAYFRDVLALVKARPIEASPMLGRLKYWHLTRYEPSAFVHGWYTVVNGRITQHGAAPTSNVSTERLNLTALCRSLKRQRGL